LALDALDELRRRGKLLQSDSGVEMAERLGDLTSDVKVFVDECCEVGVKFQVRVLKMINQIDEEMIFSDEVSDEAVEAAAGLALGGVPTLPHTYCFACPSDPLRGYSAAIRPGER